jgi:hypothetical protein
LYKLITQISKCYTIAGQETGDLTEGLDSILLQALKYKGNLTLLKLLRSTIHEIIPGIGIGATGIG